MVETVTRVVRLDFNGTGLEIAGWMLLLAIAGVLIVPAACGFGTSVGSSAA